MAQRVGAATLTTKPGGRKVRIRGTVFTLRELTIGEYDALQEKAKTKRMNPLTEREEEVPDNTALLRMMVSKSAGISLSKLDDLDMPVVVTLNALVNEMHFPPTDEGSKGALWEAVDDEEETPEGTEEEKGEG